MKKTILLILLTFVFLATLSKMYTYVIKREGVAIGEHKAYAQVQACSGGKVKVINSYPTLVEKGDPWFYYWVKGTRTGWGAKACASSHTMTSVGTLIGPGALPNYRSTVVCKVNPPESFTCTHTIVTE